MKRRPLILKVVIPLFSVALVGTYVVARTAGWIGGRAEENPAVTPSTESPTMQKTTEEKPAEYFGGSKSARVVTPKETKEFMPGSKIMVLDPLPKKDQPREPAKTPNAPKQQAQPVPAPK